ncbi:hypothetical protein AKJ09_05462 [Labilithrix luteola]|uniref:HTH luxR-type domain-containing protein n=1 Tax=Labilithrix luteola TaxID=1391654 RepID=A0A0K1PZ53_9BACT|nr:hypothetical protein AKJ09_05462 [Labilithrix luteola]
MILNDWPEALGAGRAGVYLQKNDAGGALYARGAQCALLEDYEQFGRHDDPLLARVQRRHVAAMAPIASLRARSHGYAEFAERHSRAFHKYAIVPLVANGTLCGTVCLSLLPSASAQAERRRRDLMHALSLHASTRLSQLRLREGAGLRWQGILAAEDVALCDLVTGGHTVTSMAAALGVSDNTIKKRLKRLYQRLDVASRSELAMQFMLGPEAPIASQRETMQVGAWHVVSLT